MSVRCENGGAAENSVLRPEKRIGRKKSKTNVRGKLQCDGYLACVRARHERATLPTFMATVAPRPPTLGHSGEGRQA
jgi:hypothetical protein